jgi:hypothetical protein
MGYGDRELSEGSKGLDVVELQMRLAGFRGTLPDGDFGAGTKLQVVAFQRDWMEMPNPTGRVDATTFSAIDEFATRYPVDFSQLKCGCGICTGFGQGKFKGLYYQKQKAEAFHRYEYPGIHRMALWAYRAAMF